MHQDTIVSLLGEREQKQYSYFIGIQIFFLIVSLVTGDSRVSVWSMLDTAILLLSTGLTGLIPIIDDQTVRRAIYYVTLGLYLIAIMDMSINVLLSGSVQLRPF